MHRSLHRLLLLFVAFAAGSISLVAVAPAANAATYPTATIVTASKTLVLHGGSVKIYGCGTAPSYTGDNTCAPFGKHTLQRRIAGKTTWTNVSSKTATLSVPRPVWTLKPGASAQYRVSWTGGDYPDVPPNNTFTPSTSPAVKVTVRRNLHDNWRKAGRLYYGKVTPSYGRRTVYIQKSTCSHPRSNSCRWSVYKAITTKSTGNWSVRLPASRRTTHFRAYVKPSNGFGASLSNYFITTRRG